MKIFKQIAGFVVFAVALEILWVLLRIDILEDLNLFGEVRCWPWFFGAVVLFALLAAVAARIRRPAVRYGCVIGVLAVVFGAGLLVPRMIGGDGLAVGMLQFLNGYWVLSVMVYWALVFILTKGNSNKV